MNILICIETGLREIGAHKFRSFLSMLGIVLGVSSLVATMALTAGIEKGTRTFMQQIGGLEYVNIVNKEISAAKFDFWSLSPGRTLKDAEAIRAAVPFVRYISPEINLGGLLSNGKVSDRAQIKGVWPDNFVVGRHALKAGRFFNDLDIANATHSVVIGDSIARKYWPTLPSEDVVGRILTINQSPFEIVGVFVKYEREEDARRREQTQKKGDKSTDARSRQAGRWDPFRGKNESVLIPLSTMFYEFKSVLFPDDSMQTVRLDAMSFQLSNLDYFHETLDEVRNALNNTHRGVDDYDLETREEWFDRMESSIAATRLSGGLIAIISLVVGGIGITNIMLASITERVREIGIRLAVGARGRDIFFQILVESVSIALIGGILGIAAGAVLIQALILLAPSENFPIMTWDSVVFSVAFAVVAGIVSGIYPAMRASRLDPIGALRYE